jgi:hypothetical protein
MTRLVLVIVIAAAIGALGWLNLDWASSAIDVSPIRPQESSGGASASAETSGVPADPISDDLSQSLLRPIFHASRRPFVARPMEIETEPFETAEPVDEAPETASYEELTTPPPGIALAGVNLSESSQSALLGVDGSDTMIWVPLGGSFEGWTITAVTKESVTIADGNQRAKISLYPPMARESELQ